MILFVAWTGPLFVGMSVVELVIDGREVEEEEVYAVEPDSWEDREAWLIVWFNAGRPGLPELFEKTGAVFVLERAGWAMWMATPPDDMQAIVVRRKSAFKSVAFGAWSSCRKVSRVGSRNVKCGILRRVWHYGKVSNQEDRNPVHITAQLIRRKTRAQHIASTKENNILLQH